MKAYSFKIKLLLIIFLTGLVQFSYADNKEIVSLEQASETIRKQTKGKVLSATTKTYKGVKSHRIQVLTSSGRVKVYQVPVNKNETSNRYDTSKKRINNSNNYRNKNPNYRASSQDETKRQSSQTRSTVKRKSNNRTTQSQPRPQKTRIKKPSSTNGDNKKQ